MLGLLQAVFKTLDKSQRTRSCYDSMPSLETQERGTETRVQVFVRRIGNMKQQDFLRINKKLQLMFVNLNQTSSHQYINLQRRDLFKTK